MSTTTNTRLGAFLLLASAGCIAPVEIAPLPYAHPANPDAPAGAASTAGSMLGPTSGDDTTDGAMTGMKMPHDMGGMKMPAGHGDKKSDATAGKYQCPMHSQVHSDKPGKCPICGMRLVNKGNPPKPQEDHER